MSLVSVVGRKTQVCIDYTLSCGHTVRADETNDLSLEEKYQAHLDPKVRTSQGDMPVAYTLECAVCATIERMLRNALD